MAPPKFRGCGFTGFSVVWVLVWVSSCYGDGGGSLVAHDCGYPLSRYTVQLWVVPAPSSFMTYNLLRSWVCMKHRGDCTCGLAGRLGGSKIAHRRSLAIFTADKGIARNSATRTIFTHFLRRRNRGSLVIFFAEEIAHLGASKNRAILWGAEAAKRTK